MPFRRQCRHDHVAVPIKRIESPKSVILLIKTPHNLSICTIIPLKNKKVNGCVEKIPQKNRKNIPLQTHAKFVKILDLSFRFVYNKKVTASEVFSQACEKVTKQKGKDFFAG